MNTFYDPHLVKNEEAVAFGVEIDGGDRQPVEISHEALEDHLDASPKGGKHLLGAYVRIRGEIDARARAKRMQGTLYTRQEPLILGTADF